MKIESAEVAENLKREYGANRLLPQA